MTEEVLVTIKGMQMMPEDQDEVEIVTSGKYLKKGNKHYITYEEVVEGMEGTIQNLIKMDENGMEVTKKGLTNVHMVFEKDKIHMTPYETPYGELLLGIYTKDLKVEESDDRINIRINYELDINGDKVADSEIKMCVKAK